MIFYNILGFVLLAAGFCVWQHGWRKGLIALVKEILIVGFLALCIYLISL